jgi:hypothetical protein
VDVPSLAGRIFFARPAVYLAQVSIDQQWADMNFPNRSLKKNLRPATLAAFEASKQDYRNHAAQQHKAAPAYYVLDTTYQAMLKEDKQYNSNHVVDFPMREI